MIAGRKTTTMQLSLRLPQANLGSAKPFSGPQPDTYTCSCSFCPQACLSYEQMFPSSRTSTLARRTLDALRLTRSFLLLEDDHAVDWEVDWNEPLRETHPHRAPLRGGWVPRRPGQPAPTRHLCLSPVAPSPGMPAATCFGPLACCVSRESRHQVSIEEVKDGPTHQLDNARSR